MRKETTIGQQMTLAPRMIQSMEILQRPIVALQERLQQELRENHLKNGKRVDGSPAAVLSSVRE
jgi:RNA polymerase sigma-54 factor